MSARLEALRDRYPILSGKTYLASHSLGAVPRAAQDALAEYYRHWAEQGILAWEGPWWEAMLEFSRLIEAVLGAPAGSVAPMENVTRGMAAVASCLDFSGKRNQVVMSDLEFITSYPFWQGLRERGAQLLIVPSDDGVTVPVERLVEAIGDRTMIVPTSHVYFRSGALQDLKAVTQAAHRHGAYVLGDGYQAVGTVPVDVKDLEIDFYVGGSHKWLCGGPGAGYLYVHPDLVPKLRPSFSGWFGVKDPFAYDATTRFEPADGVLRFLGGTVALPALYAAREGIRLVLEAGLPAIRAHSRELTARIVEHADRRGIEVRSPRDADRRSGMVCIEFEGSREAASALVAQGIIVDWRPRCGIRVSPHFYNTVAEIDRFFEALDGIRRP